MNSGKKNRRFSHLLSGHHIEIETACVVESSGRPSGLKPADCMYQRRLANLPRQPSRASSNFRHLRNFFHKYWALDRRLSPDRKPKLLLLILLFIEPKQPWPDQLSYLASCAFWFTTTSTSSCQTTTTIPPHTGSSNAANPTCHPPAPPSASPAPAAMTPRRNSTSAKSNGNGTCRRSWRNGYTRRNFAIRKKIRGERKRDLSILT